MDQLDTLITHIHERQLKNGGRVFALPTRAKDVVTIRGSILGGWRLLAPDKEETAVLMAGLLDAGTKSRSKEEVRERIARRGATLSFSAEAERTNFSLTCLPDDLREMLALAVECLTEPLFDANEMVQLRTRILSRVKDNKQDADSQAWIALTNLIYDKNHPGRSSTTEERLANLMKVTMDDIRAFHEKLGSGGLVVSLVGDIVPEKVIPLVEQILSSLGTGILENPPYPKNHRSSKGLTKHLFIPKKSNIDVYLGTPLPLLYDDPLHRPMQLVAAMLGGGSTGHLMDTVRDRDGLTYDIYAGLSGITQLHDGCFYINATFAPELFEKGVTTTIAETKKFIARGMTESTLRDRKEEFLGSYLVGLSTTGSLASALQGIGIRGQQISQIVEFPNQIAAATLREVKEAASLINPDLLTITAAGTFKQKK